MSNIAPDAATLISKGDSLILASFMGDSSRASTLCTLIQDRLRVMWTHIMSEIEVQKYKKIFYNFFHSLFYFSDC